MTQILHYSTITCIYGVAGFSTRRRTYSHSQPKLAYTQAILSTLSNLSILSQLLESQKLEFNRNHLSSKRIAQDYATNMY